MSDTKLTRLEDYATPGGGIDWKAYYAAKVANGERCCGCGCEIPVIECWSNMACGYPRTCRACAGITTGRNAADHHSRLRCPLCRYTWPHLQDESYHDGQELEVSCPSCDHTFEVQVSVAYTFTSPEVSPEPEPEEEDTEEEEEPEGEDAANPESPTP